MTEREKSGVSPDIARINNVPELKIAILKALAQRPRSRVTFTIRDYVVQAVEEKLDRDGIKVK